MGKNGAGKTTIVEALRYGCTGDLPNYIKGQSFVHDPKVAKQESVVGCVKMKATAVTGTPVVVSRQFQVTQQKGSGTFKTMETTISSMDENGTRSHVSKKCADVNQQVPLLLGASKAVLENVIFVHQDEANWPLGDPKSVKERFDSIFAATKYTKALEAIRKQRTEMANELKRLNESLKAAKQKKERADDYRQRERDAQRQADELQDEIRDLEAKISDAERQLNEAEKAFFAADEREKELDRVKGLKDQVQRDKASKEEEYVAKFDEELPTEGFDELDELLRDLDQKHAGFKDEIAARKKEEHELQTHFDAAKDQYEQHSLKHAQLKAELDGFRKQRERLSKAANDLAASWLDEHEQSKLTPADTVDKVAQVRDALKWVAKAAQEEAERRRSLMKSDMEQHESQVQRKREEEMRSLESARIRREELNEADQRREEAQRGLEQSHVNDDGSVKRMEEEAVRARKRADEAARKARDEEQSAQLHELRSKVSELDKQLEELNEEYRATVKEVEATAAARLRSESAAGKRRRAKEASDARLDKLEQLARSSEKELGLDPLPEFTTTGWSAPRDAKEAADRAQELAKKLGEVERHRKGEAEARREAKVEADVSCRQEEEARTEAERREASLREKLEGQATAPAEDVERRQHGLEKELEDKIREHERAKVIQSYSQSLLKHAKDKGTCGTCYQSVDGETGAKVQRTLEERMGQADKFLKQAESKIEELRHKQRECGETAQLAERWRQARDEDLPAATRRLEQAKNAASEREREREAAQEAVDRVSEKVSAANDLLERMQEAKKLQEEAESEEHKAEVSGAASSVHRSKEEIEDDLQRLREEKSRKVRERDEAEDRIESARKTAHSREDEAKAAEEKTRQMKDSVTKQRELEEQRDKATKEVSRLSEAVTSLEADAAEKGKARQNAEQARDQARQRLESSLNEADQRAKEASSAAERLEDGSLEEGSNAGRDVSAEVEEAEELERRSEERKQKKLEELKGKQSEVSNLEERLQRTERYRQQIVMAREVRRLEGTLAEHEAKAQQLEGQQAELGSRDGMRRQAESHRETVDNLREQRDTRRGTAEQLEKNRQEAAKKLSSPELQSADAEFGKTQVEMETAKFAENDLNKWHHALDNALQRFHTRKMEEVNRVLRLVSFLFQLLARTCISLFSQGEKCTAGSCGKRRTRARTLT